MILIQQIYKPNDFESEYLKCPVCKRGRLCDKPVGEQAIAIAVQGSTPTKPGSQIILKCPKCAQKFVVSFTKE